ncbi:MAG TPA: ABC transporter permease [Blastocatellia bacterium]|nr:ABC transporter permease [Blastocatellia bacterium]
MSFVLQDLRYAVRTLAKNRGFTAIAVLTLAIGIGANTAIFSAVYGILFRPLPYPDADRLAMIWLRPAQKQSDRYNNSLPDLLDWQAQNTTLEGIAAYAYNAYKLDRSNSGELVRAAIVTPDFFRLLGVNPTLGRSLDSSDERSPVAVLGHGLWQTVYHGDKNVLGQSIRLNDNDYTVVGVMPASFRFPTPDVDLWVSMFDLHKLSANPTVGNWIGSRNLRGYRAFAKLKKGVPLEQAQADVDQIEKRLGEQYREDADLNVSMVALREQMVGSVERPLLVLLAGVGFVLLISCVNVANLMLARATSREREMAIRRALGASSGRIVAQILTESLVIALLGAVFGVLLALWGVESFLQLSPAGVPRLESVRVDTSVLTFAMVTAIATGILFGFAPALRARRSDLYGALREGSREGFDRLGSRRARNMLVIFEVAVAVLLVTGAGLMIKSFIRLIRVDPGFSPDHILTLDIGASLSRYPGPDEQGRYFKTVLDKIRGVPGVESAGASTSIPPNMVQQSDGFSVGDPDPSSPSPLAWFLPASPDFIESVGLSLLDGRTFRESDNATSEPVAIINRTLKDFYFRDQDVVGLSITVSGVRRTIIGVVGDTKYDGLAAPSGFQIYVPLSQRPFPGLHVAVRTKVEPASLIGAVREAVLSVDPESPPTRLRTMRQTMAASVNEPRFYTLLLGVFAAVALLLAAIGIFGVISYSVSRRTREIGVRVALGASRRTVIWMVLREASRVTGAGLALGIASAMWLSRFLSNLLFEVRPIDPATFLTVAALLGFVALAAAYLPARRAARVEPMSALRSE